MASRAVMPNASPTNKVTIVSAFRRARDGMVRPNTWVSDLPFKVAQTVQIRIEIVTVFIPPAVPPGEPPIINHTMDNRMDGEVKAVCSTVEKPVVRNVTD